MFGKFWALLMLYWSFMTRNVYFQATAFLSKILYTITDSGYGPWRKVQSQCTVHGLLRRKWIPPMKIDVIETHSHFQWLREEIWQCVPLFYLDGGFITVYLNNYVFFFAFWDINNFCHIFFLILSLEWFYPYFCKKALLV